MKLKKVKYNKKIYFFWSIKNFKILNIYSKIMLKLRYLYIKNNKLSLKH